MMNEVIGMLSSIRPDIEFESEQSLVSAGVLDSLDIVNIIAAIESTFGIQVPFGELEPENLDSAEAISKMIERLRQ